MTAVSDPPTPKTYDVPQVAKLLDVSEKHVRKLAGAGKIPGLLRLGGAIRFSRQAVDAWLSGERSPAESRGK